MSHDSNDGTTRRTLLKAGSALAGVGFLGTASGHESGRGSGRGPKTTRYNVSFKNDCDHEAALDGATVVREFPFGAATVELTKKQAKKLERDATVRYLEDDAEMHAVQDRYPWGIERVDADLAHEEGETGDGADVSVIDTGIDPSHDDLAENVGDGECFVTCQGGCETCWDDDNGHGTHVAGTVAAARNGEGVVGVGPEITLHAAKVLDANGAGRTSDIAAAIQWTADRGYDVANLSLGGGYSSLIHDACRYAVDRGVLLVAAAGNDGCYDCVNYPAALNEVVAVSATDENDDLAPFSSYGPEIELAAPGARVESTYPGDSYAVASGTSMAAPHVSGGGALLMANGYTNDEARRRLRETADDVGLPPYAQGSGLLDVAAALALSN